MSRGSQSADPAPELDERERQLRADYAWVRHDPEVRRKFAGRVVAVCAQQVVASAKTIEQLQAALEQENCSPDKVAIVAIGM